MRKKSEILYIIMKSPPLSLRKNTGKSRSLLEWPVKARKSTKYITRTIIDDDYDGC